jgi:UDP-N-acetylglucosamine 4,6-dehydratase/5-epimerase
VNLKDKSVLVTGGTGFFGQKFTKLLLEENPPERMVIFSRDELKQHEMQSGGFNHECLRYFIGDVRDKDRLYRALDGIDVVIHAAALKQVPACEYNPIEPIKTNTLGAANLIEAAIDREVDRVIALSTDKAAAPINLYGATKLCSDKLFVAGNSYSGRHRTKFSIVRYGNVVGSRGSVVPLFMNLASTGCLPVTHPEMTRFWITAEQGVRFVLKCLDVMEGGEIFVPKIPSARIADLAKAIDSRCTTEIVGIRPGEKMHEVLVPEDEARMTLEYEDRFVIFPAFQPNVMELHKQKNGGRPCPEGFRYSSDTNSQFLSVDDLRALVSNCL